MDKLGKILIVDDETMVTKTLSMLLGLEGFSNVYAMNSPLNALEFLKTKLYELLPNCDINIKYFQEDSIVRKKGDIRQISISDNSDEKINLDIFSLFFYGDYALTCYLDSFFYAPKYLVEETIKYPYKDFHVSIPKNYDKLLTDAYGKNYIIPVKKWSGSDYKCLITREELEKLVNKK